MTSFSSKSIRLALLAAAGGLGLGTAPAYAQPVNSAYGAARPDPGADLSRHLRSLSESPRSLSALTGAGEAALALGDPQAAITFFARAEEVAPRDGRVKAGLGSALLKMEQAPAALKFFSEATSLGFPEVEVAGDRGLAHDLSGDPASAQRDYALVLRNRDDAEVRRRMALSMAISGDREGALQMIDAQVRTQDRAAWRTRAFVLALTGDAAEATRAVEAVMPAQAAAMQPFFARLPALAPAQRAMAVHFGHFPSDGQAVPFAVPSNTQLATVAPNVTAAGRPDSAQARLGATRAPAPAPAATTRRRPSTAEAPVESVNTRIRSARPRVAAQAPAAAPATRPATTPPPVQPRVAPPTVPTSNVQVAANRAAAPPAVAVAGPGFSVAPAANRAATPPAVAANRPAVAAEPVAKPPVALTGLPPSVAAEREAEAGRPAVAGPIDTPAEPANSGSFADVAATIAALPTPLRPQAPAPDPAPAATAPAPARAETPKPAAKKAEPAKKPAPKKAAEKKPEPKEPSRHWVQIAGGADKAAMGREFTRLKAKAPKLLSDQSAWTTPLNATNRLLVGPFKSADAAQAFVNDLAGAELSAFSWTSPAGQEIEKLTTK